MSRKYKIGITCNFESNVPDIWANGVNQNVVFLYRLFEASSIVEDVVLVSWGPEKKSTPPSGFMMDDEALNCAYVEDVINELDVLIEGTLVIEPQYMHRMHDQDRKSVV